MQLEIEISDSLISELVNAGFADRITLFDAVLNQKGIDAVEKIICPSPGQSLASGFYCGGKDS